MTKCSFSYHIELSDVCKLKVSVNLKKLNNAHESIKYCIMEKAITTHAQDCLQFMSLNVCGLVSRINEFAFLSFQIVIQKRHNLNNWSSGGVLVTYQDA